LLTNKEVEDEKRDNAGSRTGLAIGSNLWVYRNQPKTDQVLEEMKLAAFESLEWMITEGIASDVEVAIGQSDLDKASLKIKIYKANSNKFKALWDDASGEAIKINPYGDQLEIGFE
jgi:phage gp46-like protein